MGRTGHEAFGDYLLGLAQANPGYYQPAARGLVWLAETNPSERVRALLRDALVLGGGVSRGENRARDQLLACLVRLGDSRAIPLLKSAYELGLEGQPYLVPIRPEVYARAGGAQWLGAVLAGGEIIKWHGYSDEDLAKCFAQLLTLDDSSIWAAALGAVGHSVGSDSSIRVVKQHNV